MKKQISKLLALMICLSMVLTACGGQADSQQEGGPEGAQNQIPENEPQTLVEGQSDDETLTIALAGEPSALYLQYDASKYDCAVAMCLFDTLVLWDEETQTATPALATSWEWIDDTHVRFQLRDDVIMADGSKMTAEDVVYTFEVGTRYNNQSAYTRAFDVENFVVESDTSFIMALNFAYPTLFDRISNHYYHIISKSATEAVGGEEAAIRNPQIGSGKYRFVEWVDSQYIRLERNDNYWDADNMPYYKYIEFTFINDSAARAMAVESGDVDVAADLMATQIESLIGVDGLTLSITDTTNTNTLFMNCSTGPLADERVREAIFLLVNPQAVKMIANGGYGTLAETHFSPHSYVYAAPGSDYDRSVNVERARELLEDAGYGDGLTITNMTFSNVKPFAEVIQANLLEGGITLEIEQLERGTFLNNLFNGDYESYIRGMESWDPVISLNGVDSRVAFTTAMGGAQYEDAALHALIDQAHAAMDETARIAVYAEIQQYVREHFVTIGLCSELNIDCVRTGLSKPRLDTLGYPFFADIRPVA